MERVEQHETCEAEKKTQIKARDHASAVGDEKERGGKRTQTEVVELNGRRRGRCEEEAIEMVVGG